MVRNEGRLHRRSGRRRCPAVRIVLWAVVCAAAHPSPLRAAGSDPSERRQREAEAVRAIGTRTSSEDLQVLLRRSDNKYIRGIAARWLGERRYRPARDALFLAMDDAEEYVQRYSAVAYARLCGCRVENRLMERFTASRESTRFAAIGAAIEILDRCAGKTPTGMGVVMRGTSTLLRDTSPLVRREAVVLLRSVPPAVLAERGTGVLLGALDDPDAKVRGEAVRALYGVKTPRVARALLPLLDDPDPVVQRNVVRVLAATGDPAAIRAVRNLLGRKEAHVRVQGVRALVAIGDPSIASDLVFLLDDRIPRVRAEAVTAIAKLNPLNAAALLTRALADRDAGIRRTAVRALGNLCPKDDRATAVAVVGLTTDRNRTVAFDAVTAVRCMRNVQTLPEMVNAFCRIPHADVRAELLDLLKTLTFENPGNRCLDWRQWLRANEEAAAAAAAAGETTTAEGAAEGEAGEGAADDAAEPPAKTPKARRWPW